MLQRFSQLQLVKEGVRPYPGLTDSEPAKLADQSWSPYELDEQAYERLRRAFANLVPNISAELTRIRTKTVPEDIEGYKKSYKRFLRDRARKRIKQG
jgi:hypothetical protein